MDFVPLALSPVGDVLRAHTAGADLILTEDDMARLEPATGFIAIRDCGVFKVADQVRRDDCLRNMIEAAHDLLAMSPPMGCVVTLPIDLGAPLAIAAE